MNTIIVDVNNYVELKIYRKHFDYWMLNVSLSVRH